MRALETFSIESNRSKLCLKTRPFGMENFKHLVQCLVAKLKLKRVGQFIGNWHRHCPVTTILKLGWDFGPGAVCDAVGACKLVDFIPVGGIPIANCV